jgi:hypothetical protein
MSYRIELSASCVAHVSSGRSLWSPFMHTKSKCLCIGLAVEGVAAIPEEIRGIFMICVFPLGCVFVVETQVLHVDVAQLQSSSRSKAALSVLLELVRPDGTIAAAEHTQAHAFEGVMAIREVGAPTCIPIAPRLSSSQRPLTHR